MTTSTHSSTNDHQSQNRDRYPHNNNHRYGGNTCGSNTTSSHPTSTTKSTTTPYKLKKKSIYSFAAFALVFASTFHTTRTLRRFLTNDNNSSTPSRVNPSSASMTGLEGENNAPGKKNMRNLLEAPVEATTANHHDGTNFIDDNNATPTTMFSDNNQDYEYRKQLLQEQVKKQKQIIQTLQKTIQQEEASSAAGSDVEASNFGEDASIERLVKLMSELSSSTAEAQEEINIIDDKLERDRDAWYGDSLAGSTSRNNNNPEAGSNHHHHHGLNVTIMMRRHRIDRLGGNVRRPFHMYALAQCKGYKFCIEKGKEGVSKSLNFPTCPDNLEDFSPLKGRFFATENNPIKESGTYIYGGIHNGPDDKAVYKAVHELDEKCAFSDDFRKLWRNMILQKAPKDPSLNTTLAQQNFFSGSNNTMTIAVNIRRGDVTSYKRAIWDEIYVKVLKQLRAAIVKRLGKTPEVHLFSEDYGMIDIDRKISINWSLYRGLVDHFHLAPNMQSQRTRHNMDVALNIRDWRHFVKADILVVGGTFSEIPAYGRPSSPDPVTGSGLTLYPCASSKKECSRSNKAHYWLGWSRDNGGRKNMDQTALLNMPPILAPLDNSKQDAKSTSVVENTNAAAGKEIDVIDNNPFKETDEELKLVAAELARDHDAWYSSDAIGKDPLHNQNLNITIKLDRARIGQLESNLERPFYLYAYAKCKGYKFCIAKGGEGSSKIFNFPSCPENLEDFSPPKGQLFGRDKPLSESGTYSFGSTLDFKDDGKLFKAIDSLDSQCVFSDYFRQLWRDMILQASNTPRLERRDLFSGGKTTTTIAVSIERGNAFLYKRPIWDDIYVNLLQQLRLAVERNGKKPEVHLFSEDYGFIDQQRNVPLNWSLYEGLVDNFHLAPKHSQHDMDIARNIRDWMHFVRADILVVGGTYSEIPAYGRPTSPDPFTASGLTLYPCPSKYQCSNSNKTHYVYSWTVNQNKMKSRMNKLELLNLPSVFTAEAAATATDKKLEGSLSAQHFHNIVTDVKKEMTLIDIALARDRDAWYGGIAGGNPAYTHGLNVTIKLDRPRIDRLGSNVARPFYLYAYAKCQGYKFCIEKGKEGISRIFNFPTCPHNLEDFSPPRGLMFQGSNSASASESGTYVFGDDVRGLGRDYRKLLNSISQLDSKCVFSDEFRQLWRDMILQASKDPSLNTILSKQDLFSKSKNTMTIAVNIRRGDMASYKQLIWDEVYVKLVEQLRQAVERTGRTPEVHLFSEDYGMINLKFNLSPNWSLYEGLVDHFHLAPKMSSANAPHAMDMALNMRDWRHFVKADILVVGGTFSEIPSYGRPSSPDPETGAGLTLYPCPSKNQCSTSDKAHYVYGWTVNQDKTESRMDKLELLNMPQILAPNGSTRVSNSVATIGDTNSVEEAGTEISTINDQLARDRDAWYGDIAGGENPYNHNLNVTIMLRRQRIDRLGGNVRRPFYMYALAQCKGYKFCIEKGKEGVSKSLNFPNCPNNLEDFSPTKGRFFAPENNPIKESGTYIYGGVHNGPDDMAIHNAVHKLDVECAFSDDFRKLWRKMILQSSKDPSLNTTLAQQELFSGSERTMTIAVNIRRGDITGYKGAIWDEIYVKLLEQLRLAVERLGKTPEVHVFSEDYGMIDNERNVSLNWDLYEGVVDGFHLAPNMQSEESTHTMNIRKRTHNMDVSLNMRDWRHFVKADILVVGGTFSEIPAFGRPSSPDPETGSGLTLYPCPAGVHCDKLYKKSKYTYGWTVNQDKKKIRMDQLELLNMPQVLAPPIEIKHSKSTVVVDDTTTAAATAATVNLDASAAPPLPPIEEEQRQTRPSVAMVGNDASAASASSTFTTPDMEAPARQNVSLVTSFFADGLLTLKNVTTGAKDQHLHEISAAILKNIHNPYFAQVVVILDGARDEANCNHFRDYLEHMQQNVLEWSHQHTGMKILDDVSLQKLTCVNREQSQPSYFEMFQYATNFNATESPIVTSPIVILENADQVFDETLYWAGLIKPHAILALPTHGYSKNDSPPDVTAYFQFATLKLSKLVDWEKLNIPARCRGRSYSWDGFIFHQDYVRETLLDPHVFQRPTSQNSTAFFNMNELGAENAALWALLRNVPNGTQTGNGCSIIKTWHYHAAPKMHADPKTRGFEWTPREGWVPRPYVDRPPLLSESVDAFLVDPKKTN